MRPFEPVMITLVIQPTSCAPLSLTQNYAGVHRLPQLLAVRFNHPHQREPIFFFDDSQHRQSSFDWNGIGFNEQVFEQFIIPLVELQRGVGPAGGKFSYHTGDLSWNDIGSHADDSISPYSHERQREAVIAAHDFKPRTQCGSQLADPVG